MNDMKLRRLPLTTALLALGLATNVQAGAATDQTAVIPAGSYSFGTYLTPEYSGAGSYEGVLRLTVNEDGTISGFFRNADVGTFHTVVGGRNGKYIWLDLGSAFPSRLINATYENGKIVGGVYTGSQPYSFVASPDSKLGGP
jgi:hypothetical protein